MLLPAKHEYDGFWYTIDGTLKQLTATPVEGQHPAANKEKHKAAAVEAFLQDHGERAK